MSQRWPYPSFGDPGWLSGVDDPALTLVANAVRDRVTATGRPVDDSPDSLLAALAVLPEIAERVDWAMLSLVGEARAAGLSWATIGRALGVSKQAVQRRFAPYVEKALTRTVEG